MGIKLSTWTDDKAKIEISKKWKHCLDARSPQEDRWIKNEKSVYSTNSIQNMAFLQTSLESNFNTGMPGVDGSNADVSIAYTMKNFRFIHAQMSSNPPSVAMRPSSSDQEDHRKADAADRIVRWALRHYSLQEKVDQLTLHTLLYGTGVLKTVWDSTRGDIIEFDPKLDEIKLEGDIAVTVPFIWNIFIDPDAKSIDEIKYVIERIYMDYEEACVRWPEKQDQLKKARIEKKDQSVHTNRESVLSNDRYNSVELLEYWETGLPSNAYLGRFCVTTSDGEVIESCRPSPFRFKQAGATSKIEASDLPDAMKEEKLKRIPEQAYLPFHILTDIDVPNTVWGKSAVEYAAQLQENLNRLDSATLDNIQAHGVARLIIPESADIADDGLSNSAWDVTKISGAQPPYFMKPPELMPDMTAMRVNHVQGIDTVFGVNENMFGNQSREQSGASMQYATNQGNMIRRRIFNKYVLTVESVYKAILNLVRKHWTTQRTISVLGKEKALEAIDIKGMDVDGGFDVVGEYGTTLSLDPITRQQQVQTLQPLFKEAGVPARTSLRMMKLAELDSMYDKLDLAGDRQKEIFDEMIATQVYIRPKPYRDHENMIAWALEYFMTSEYEMLPDEVQLLCEQHIQERAAVAAQEKTGMAGGQAQAPAPAPMGAAPAPEAMPPAPAEAPIPQ